MRAPARPLGLGIVVAVGFLVAEVLAVLALKRIAPENAFGALLLLGVLVVSAGWGFGLAIMTSLASAAVYAYFHLEGQDSLAPALAIFLTLAFLTNSLVGQARLRAAEADQRRREADLAADLARVMLRAPALTPALEDAGRRLADVLGLHRVTLTVGDTPPGDDQLAIALLDGSDHTGTLLVPKGLPSASMRRAHRMVPSLQALLAAARDREDMTAELEASRRELERFFAVASDLLFIGDAERMTRVNPAFEQALGYSYAELTARPLIEFIHADDRTVTTAALAAVPRSDGATQFENRCLRRDGGVRWLEWNVVFDHGVLLGGARDVTERRQEQDRLRVARTQQAALRRVATLVARGAGLPDVFDVAVAELAQSLDVNHVTLVTFENDGGAVVRAALNRGEQPGWVAGERVTLDGDSVCERVRRTGRPARIDDYSTSRGEIAARLRTLGVRSGAGAPLVVDGRARGVLLVGSHSLHSVPDSAETHIGDFADLISTAIANAETRAELTASRARIVAAADEARRGFERDLHDGAQQRIVSLSLQLREAQAAAEDDEALRTQLSTVVDGLAGLHSDLQELSRGLHPAVLSRGGLRPAMRNLARRSAVPVDLVVDVDHRLPVPVEVAAYYVAAESLTNIAKHADADSATVAVAVEEDGEGRVLTLSVTDDGTGGASTDGGSGLVGLRDRVEALSGSLSVTSRPGEGTRISATIPIEDFGDSR